MELTPKEDLEPKVNAVGASCVFVCKEGPIGASVLAQYPDATADLSVSLAGSEILWFVVPPVDTVKIGAAIGELSFTLSGVEYGSDIGQWNLPVAAPAVAAE